MLNCRETRELVRACAADQRFQTLRGFLKGVLVIVQPGNRTKRIADLVRSAGDEEFFKDDQKISVAVSTFSEATSFVSLSIHPHPSWSPVLGIVRDAGELERCLTDSAVAYHTGVLGYSS